jgi:hypothetical protein
MENLYIHPVYSDYACDLDGNIFSKKFNKGGNKTGEFKQIKLGNNHKGYLNFSILNNGKQFTKKAHQFIWEAVTKTLPIWGKHYYSLTINHINQNGFDNRFTNLEIKTLRENIQLRKKKN